MSDFEDAARALRKWIVAQGFSIEDVSLVVSAKDARTSRRVGDAAMRSMVNMTDDHINSMHRDSSMMFDGLKVEFAHVTYGNQGK